MPAAVELSVFMGTRLWVAHLLQACSNKFHGFSIVEERAKFCLDGGRHHVSKSFTLGVEYSIRGRFPWRKVGRSRVTDCEISTGVAPGILDGQVGCVALDEEAHTTGMIPDGCVGVRCIIVEEHGACLGGVGSECRLFGRNGVEGHEHCIVNGPCIVEEGANNLQDAGDLCRW